MQIKVDNMKRKFEKNKSIPYYFLTSIFIVGVLFFLSSNIIFNKEISLINTEINKEITSSGLNVTLKDRQYNSESGLVQFTLKTKNQNLNGKIALDFEIREKNNPTEIIPCKVIKITNSDYIITTKIDKKWDALSLTVIDKNTSGSYVKIYSDIREITINNELKEKGLNEYTVEIIDNEIKDIHREIEEINKLISNKNSNISSLEDNINTLEADKKYQTESEIETTENTIQSNKSSIEQLKNEIKIESEKSKEYEEKIKKLEEKKKNFL